MNKVVTPPGGVATTGLASSIPGPTDTWHSTLPVFASSLIIRLLTAVPTHT